MEDNYVFHDGDDSIYTFFLPEVGFIEAKVDRKNKKVEFSIVEKVNKVTFLGMVTYIE